MASSKKNKNTTPQDQALAAKRVEFVKSKPELAPVEARTRFFVQTRAAELQAKGVEVTKQKRQELRQKFASGDVQRTGFYTPADIARAAARNSGTSSTPMGGTSSGSGQNLSEYKQSTGKDQAVRVGRAAAQQAPKGNPLGVSDRFAGAVKNPVKDFSNSILGGAIKGAYKMAAESAESFNATFINPTVNLAGKVIGKNPNLRQAGAKEAAFNTVMLGLDIASAGQTRAASAAIGPVTREALAVRAAQKAPGFFESAVAYGSNKAGQVFGKTFPESVVARAEGLATKVESAATNAAKQKVSPSGKIARAAKADVKTAVKTETKSAVKGAKLKAASPTKSSTPKAGVKSAGSASSAPKNAAGKPYTKMKDIDVDIKFGNAAEKTAGKKAKAVIETPAPKASTPKSASKPKATPKAKPAATAKPKAAPKEVNRFADAWDDSPIDMSKVNFSEMEMRSTKPYSTARRSTKVKADVAPAAAPKAAAPKTTAPKARAKAGFKAKVNEVKATPAPAAGKSSFGSQAEYDTWLSKGGKQELRNMTQSARDSFLEANKKFVVGAGKKAQQAAASQSQKTARAIKTEKLYKGARPELQGLFNKALLNRQQRQLLAKIAPKK